MVCGVVACREEDQLYCPSLGKCVAAALYYCNGRDECGDATDEPDNCSQPALSLSLSLLYIYTVSQKKTRHQTLAHNFPKC